MTKKLRLFAFLGAYAFMALSLVFLKQLGGWWWLMPLAGVAAMVIVVLWAERGADEVVSKTALNAYQYSFWVVILVLLAADFARAFGEDVRIPFLWALGLGVWVVIYVLGLWRMR